MQKITRIAGIVTGLILILYLGTCFYMVACISCTPDSVKTYNYPGSMNQLENNFISYSKANPDIDCKISHRVTDSVAAKDSIPAEIIAIAARDVLIKQKINGSDIECHLVISDFNNNTKLDIEEIFDRTHKTGGNNANDKYVKELLAEFESSFLTRFKQEQHIEFKKKSFSF